MPNADNKNSSLINNYAHRLKSSLFDLGQKIPESEIETLAIFLVRAMGSELRNYHRPEHPLDVSRSQTPIARMAALFHDIVYVQVDPNWKNFLGDLLGPMVPADNYTMNVKENLQKTTHADRWPRICSMVFGFEQEEKLQPLTGLNEFMSALVVTSKLQKFLSDKDLIKIVSCIEATIPFRRIDSLGNSPAKRLKVRLSKASNEFNLDLNDNDINQAALDCRSIVENDLSGFRSEKLGFFLSDSWNVLSENHATLRNTFFLISDYKKAVFGLIGFFQMLDPENMFWNDVTPLSPHSRLYADRARYNLKNGAEYMKAFFLSVALLEAIALETGGDVPYEFFVGAKKSSREHTPPEISDFLTFEENPSLKSVEEKDIYSVLKNGRVVRAKFDRKECPLGAYLYQRLHAMNQFDHYFNLAVSFHKGELKGKDFIQHFPKEITREVLMAVSELAITRADKIRSLIS